MVEQALNMKKSSDQEGQQWTQGIAAQQLQDEMAKPQGERDMNKIQQLTGQLQGTLPPTIGDRISSAISPIGKFLTNASRTTAFGMPLSDLSNATQGTKAGDIMQALGLTDPYGINIGIGGQNGQNSSNPRTSNPYDPMIASNEQKLAFYNSMVNSGSPMLVAKYSPLLKDMNENNKTLYALRDDWVKNQGGAGLATRGTPELADLENAGRESVQLHAAFGQFKNAIASGNPQEIQKAAQAIEGSEKLMEGIRRLPQDDQDALLSVANTGDISSWLDKPNGVIVPSKVTGVLNGIANVAEAKDKLYETMLKQQRIEPNSSVAQQYNPDFGTWDWSKERQGFNDALKTGVGEDTFTKLNAELIKNGKPPLTLSQKASIQDQQAHYISGQQTAKDTFANLSGLLGVAIPIIQDVLKNDNSKSGDGSNKNPKSPSSVPSSDEVSKYQRAKDAAVKAVFLKKCLRSIVLKRLELVENQIIYSCQSFKS